ncbi:hypothetical protein D9M71_655950 [compost metagenome]
MQAAQGAFHQLLQAPAVARFQLLLDAGELREIIFVLNVQAQVVIAGQQFADLGEPLGDHVVHRTIIGARQLLRQFADLQRRRPPDVAVIGHLLALDQLEHARLAGAVAADDADPLSPGDLPGHLVQQRRGAKGKGHIGELQQGHWLSPETGRAV